MSLRKLYEEGLKEALADNYLDHPRKYFTHQDFNNIPFILKNYLESCGYIGSPKHQNILLHFEDAEIKMKPGKKWLHLTCQQFNSAYPPVRIALLQSKLYGFVQFGAIDRYQHGHGDMHVKLAGLTINKNSGMEMDRAALVTYLAESILLPAALLQNNISWQAIAADHIKASLTDAGMTVTGEFYFNKNNQLHRFKTEDRFFSEGAEYVRRPWSAFYEKFEKRNGIRMPTSIRAVWHMPDNQDFEYFRAIIKKVDYNLSSPKS